MTAFNYGFKLDPMSGEMRYQPILNRRTSSTQASQTAWNQPQATDQFNMTNFGYGPSLNTGYNGFAAVNNSAYNGFNAAATGGYGNTGFPTQGGAFGGGYTNIPGPAMFGSPSQLTAQNSATFNNLLTSMPGSLGILQGLDLPGVFGGGNLTNAVAQQGYSLDGGSAFTQPRSVAANPWMAPGTATAGYNTASTLGYTQPGQFNYNQSALGPSQAQFIGNGAFAQNYQSPLNTYQYPMTQTAQGYYGQPSQAFGYQPSPFQTGGYQGPPVGYTQYANAQPYYQQPGAFSQQGVFPQQGSQTAAASVGGFANTPLGQAGGANGFGNLGDVSSLLAKADSNLASAQRITDLLDGNKLSSSIKSTTQTLNTSLDAQKNWSAQDVLALSFNMNDILGDLNL